MRHHQGAEQLLKGLLEQQITFFLSRPTETPRWVDDLTPRNAEYADRNGFAEIIGRWPGDEADAVVEDALEKLS